MSSNNIGIGKSNQIYFHLSKSIKLENKKGTNLQTNQVFLLKYKSLGKLGYLFYKLWGKVLSILKTKIFHKLIRFFFIEIKENPKMLLSAQTLWNDLVFIENKIPYNCWNLDIKEIFLVKRNILWKMIKGEKGQKIWKINKKIYRKIIPWKMQYIFK